MTTIIESAIQSTGRLFPVTNIGHIAWTVSSYTGEPGSDKIIDGPRLYDFAEFQKILRAIKWTPHFRIPDGIDGNRVKLAIYLDQPYRDSGMETIEYWFDLGKFYGEFKIDGDNVKIKEMKIPKELILALKSIMFELQAKQLSIYYGADKEEDDNPLLISIDFYSCKAITDPDSFIAELAKKLSTVIKTT